MTQFLLVLLTAAVLPATAATPNEAAIKAIHDRITANGMGNGDISLTRYNPARFDLTKAMKDLRQQARASWGHPRTCRFDFQKGRRNNLKLLADENFGVGSDIADDIRKLFKAKQIKAILSATWDSGHDMSENCSIYTYEIYTEDGWLLYIHLNYTT